MKFIKELSMILDGYIKFGFVVILFFMVLVFEYFLLVKGIMLNIVFLMFFLGNFVFDFFEVRILKERMFIFYCIIMYYFWFYIVIVGGVLVYNGVVEIFFEFWFYLVMVFCVGVIMYIICDILYGKLLYFLFIRKVGF